MAEQNQNIEENILKYIDAIERLSLLNPFGAKRLKEKIYSKYQFDIENLKVINQKIRDFFDLSNFLVLSDHEPDKACGCIQCDSSSSSNGDSSSSSSSSSGCPPCASKPPDFSDEGGIGGTCCALTCCSSSSSSSSSSSGGDSSSSSGGSSSSSSGGGGSSSSSGYTPMFIKSLFEKEFGSYIDEFLFDLNLFDTNLTDVTIQNNSSSSSGCPTTKLHIWFETFSVPDRLIIYGAKKDDFLSPVCSQNSSSSSSDPNILLDTGLISTYGWKYYCVEIPSNIVQYKYEVVAPFVGTVWLLDIRSTCDTIPCNVVIPPAPSSTSGSSSSSTSGSSSSSSSGSSSSSSSGSSSSSSSGSSSSSSSGTSSSSSSSSIICDDTQIKFLGTCPENKFKLNPPPDFLYEDINCG